MSLARADFMAAMKTLNQLSLPSIHRIAIWIIITFVLAAVALLTLTPWVQTAYGTGSVNSLNPLLRIQPISALLDGQIEQWHVSEGERVRQGQPIVTLVDVDADRLEKIRSQQAAATQRFVANQQAVKNAQSNLSRQQTLLLEGLVSPKAVEQVEIELEKLKAELAKTEEDLNSIRMTLARQETRTKVAPMDGTVVRLRSIGAATYIKAGEQLGSFVPDNIERQVSIKVNGLDAALVSKGRAVRIQFEGWPAFQFSGWPGISVGTFAGIVTFVEPVADQNGEFTVWVSPDPSADPWPEHDSARLGSRVRAWILLEEVQLGYELWRQLNNFPPLQTTNREPQ
ncbi:HlyD family efflux transporter periplasmic adaptor subunit [Alteromonas aestuariivivens]|uniref:HlyD family efflux transporter periplasmic adaptor subunit n=1 Tax=Alteromonas aestuariivivens TaxID=1938339 RepID=A0A3D8M774_9ALTE|nr:biotin/lipoyl-binding protein [Alteromonas aestuariivivens]RDV25578.1 HlyD family efflux transporter periplasmic adaptor subunit [Alteromonas aestuariivivens]